jgi:4-carboxymuconolactone decarboxylase
MARKGAIFNKGGEHMAESERYQKGAAKMKELFGTEPRPGTMQEDFLNITVENLFGDIWGRPGLETHERSMITVAALTVLGRSPEMKVHIRGALNVGISREKIQEMMIHLAHYGGWPVGVNGLRIAQEVFDSIDKKNKG